MQNPINTLLKPPSVNPLAFAVMLAIGTPAISQQPSEQQLPEIRVSGGNPTAGTYVTKEAGAGALGERSLIETPFSVNVIKRELIEDQQASYLGDYLKNDPSAAVSNVPVGFLTLRGFTVGTDGFLYDGMPGHLGLQDGRGYLEGFERVEVLKGASSFLYGFSGASSLGGMLNYVPKRAPDTPVRSISLGYATKSLFGVHADVGDRFGVERQFGYRVNLVFKNGEQTTEGYDWKHTVGTLALDWRVTPNFVLSANYDAADNDLPRLQPFFLLSPGLAVPKAPDASRNIALSWDNFETRTRNSHIRADWTFAPDWSLTAQALHASNKRPLVKNARFGAVLDAAGNAMLFGDEGIYDVKDTSAQVRLNGKFATGGLKHELAVGVNTLREKTRLSVGSSLGVFMTNLYHPVDSPEPASTAITANVSQRARASGVFASDIVRFTERWSVLLGARRAKLEQDNFDVATGAPTTSASLSKTTPTFALMFNPTPSSLIYANYAEGLEQGGTAPVGTVNANQRLAPMVTEQIELGGKLNLQGLTLTAALFDMKKPLEITNPVTNLYTQSGEQRHRGVEFTGTGKVTSDLTLVAGLMLLDPKANGTGDAMTEGRTPVGVPKANANLWASYRLPGAPGFSVNGGMFYSSAQYVDGANTQKVSSWTRLDLGLRYDMRLAGKLTSFLLGVENVADRNYWTGAQTGLLVLSNPRTLKLAARIDL